jgi:hypothetical protein
MKTSVFNCAHLDNACDFSEKENLLNEIKTKGYLKYRNKSTISPYIMAYWTLEDMVEEGILIKENVTEGNFFFRKNYIIYKLK